MTDLSDMSLEQARRVIWPFRELKGKQMGELFDNGLLRLQDLGFASERAYNLQVKQAARVLLKHALEDETSLVEEKALNVITSQYRSYAERQQYILTLYLGTFAGFVFSILLAFLFFIWRSVAQNPSSPATETSLTSTLIAFAILILIAAGVYMLFARLIDFVLGKFEKRIRLYRKGQRAEDHLFNQLLVELNGDWWLFRNLELPGQRAGDIDFVLVGPQGVWAIETKIFSGDHRVIGDQWEFKLVNRWIPALQNPSVQAKRNAAKLSHILKTHELKQWITPLVVWVNPDSTLMQENPSVNILRPSQIRDALTNNTSRQTLSSDKVTTIASIIKGLYEKPLSNDEALMEQY